MIDIGYVLSFVPVLVLPIALILSIRLSRISLGKGLVFLVFGCTFTLFCASPFIYTLGLIKSHLRAENLPWDFDLNTISEWHKLVGPLSMPEAYTAFSLLLFIISFSYIVGSLSASRVLGLQWKRGITLTFLFSLTFLLLTVTLALLIRLLLGGH